MQFFITILEHKVNAFCVSSVTTLLLFIPSYRPSGRKMKIQKRNHMQFLPSSVLREELVAKDHNKWGWSQGSCVICLFSLTQTCLEWLWGREVGWREKNKNKDARRVLGASKSNLEPVACYARVSSCAPRLLLWQVSFSVGICIDRLGWLLSTFSECKA